MNSKEKALCDSIFERHPEAIEVIVRNNMSREIETALLKSLVALEKRNGFELEDVSDKDEVKYIIFYIKDLVTYPPFYMGFSNGGGDEETSLFLSAYAPDSKKKVKEFRAFAEQHEVFNGINNNKNWPRFYYKEILPARSALTESGRISTIVQKWQEFLEKDLPRIEKAMRLFHKGSEQSTRNV